ncbi:PDDEXK nuclease domain-containing protein [Marinirhabdus gelatinilytica]|uniref:Putative nuclease of restriction endonuclease-like (RecB) superfamily n=1 Tax=Marinirhabdus gelatinilytica TaxID=1703343 RepID=A0A370Q362_9FLAO|nr:PDDEXK nuclease domain-containing protein [Marinirhabdus gelatinilytica]RDK82767.1 putative nuclease of restriction endonuclease-like (RecB) superfamily [Marinirhabdus gelatinilytica]
MSNKLSNNKFHSQIVNLLQSARNTVVRSVNQTMVLTYFEIGKMIVMEEQGGKERAEYGKEIIKGLSKILTKEFGKGFSERNLEQMRQFYLVYSKPQSLSAESKTNKPQTLSALLTSDISPQKSENMILSWSHYLKLMRIDDENERSFYEIEAFKNNWSVRELQRQFDSALYTRLVLSRNKDKVKELSEKGLVFEKPKDAIKDPYILEFIGLPEHSEYSETELEQEIIDKLEHFLLELGNGFTFVARQKRISFDDKHFRIDLVFYNRFLKCFVLIDLKIGEIKHQDLGQMQMYVNYYDREIRLDEENKTIGIVLCRDKSQSVVEYTLPENNEQIFASKYETVLPSKEELKSLIAERNSQR